MVILYNSYRVDLYKFNVGLFILYLNGFLFVCDIMCFFKLFGFMYIFL